MILDDIVAQRRIQLEQEKASCPPTEMERIAKASPLPARNFREALCGERLAVIAEVKKASPSKGLIQPDFHPAATAKAYEAAGAGAVSVLTEAHYFQGSSAYLREVRIAVNLPILRKDFIFDPYQIYEARAIGADAVLLIAAILTKRQLADFLELAGFLGLDCLTEVHSREELDMVLETNASIIGINNRNLKTFHVDLETTEQLTPIIPPDKVIVSESGIASNEDARRLRACGANAVLVGETLMRSGDIAHTFAALTDGV